MYCFEVKNVPVYTSKFDFYSEPLMFIVAWKFNFNIHKPIFLIILLYLRTTFCGNEGKAMEPKQVCATAEEYSPTSASVFSA